MFSKAKKLIFLTLLLFTVYVIAVGAGEVLTLTNSPKPKINADPQFETIQVSFDK